MPSSDQTPQWGNAGPQAPRPFGEETTLRTDQIQIERKNFAFILKENPRGRFLRIIEDVGGRRNTIIIPAPGLEGFRKVLEEMVKAAAGDPSVHQP